MCLTVPPCGQKPLLFLTDLLKLVVINSSPSFCSREASSDSDQVRPTESLSVPAGSQTGGSEARPPAGRTDPPWPAALAAAGCHLRQEHDGTTPARRHLPGDGRRAGRPTAGQQGVHLALQRQEPEGSSAPVEAAQMQEPVGGRVTLE